MADAMTTVNIREAKSQFSRLLERVAQGDEIVIAKYGKPIAKLVPYRETRRGPRVPGTEKGKIWISDDFDEFTQDLEKDFDGDGAATSKWTG